jgi:hypothetical protein
MLFSLHLSFVQKLLFSLILFLPIAYSLESITSNRISVLEIYFMGVIICGFLVIFY